MMKKSVLAAALLALMAAPAMALQVEVTGTAPVISENFEAARTRAIEAGRTAYLAGLGRTLPRGASASDPLTGFLH